MSNEAKDTKIIGTYSLAELVSKLKRPRRVMMMIKAGAPVDSVIASLLPLLDEGDIIIDGGNSNFQDSIRRTKDLREKGILFVGTGVSGGEEGARFGPSIMPGGAPEAWPHVKDILQAIAAKIPDGAPDAGLPCCDWLGEDGAGHFVKMVHNGIEYGDMQLIAEAYDLMKTALGMSNEEMSAVFKRWDTGKLDSFLIEITGDILAYKDENGQAVLDVILDSAGQKGTGKWTAVAALDSGIPLTLIGEAVFARFLSALKDDRLEASQVLRQAEAVFEGDKQAFLADLEQALYAAKLMSYTQGYMLFRAAAAEYSWNLNYGGIALLWREGCIIRSAFLTDIQKAFAKKADLSNLLLDDFFKEQVETADSGWRRVVSKAVELGVPVPAMSSALSFYDSYRRGRLPANMLQAQRDYFGAHTYERLDKPRGQFFHTNWTGEGGDVTSSSYNV